MKLIFLKKEKQRIKAKKERIETDLYKQIQISLKDIDEIDNKIITTEAKIKEQNSEILEMEHGNNRTRRQMIKNNNIYLYKKKNLKKVKNNLQYQLANINLEIYQIDLEFKLSAEQILVQHKEEDIKSRARIVALNNDYSFAVNQVQDLEDNVKNKSSKTWQLNYQEKVSQMENTQILLTDEIQSYNIMMSQQKADIQKMEYHYKYLKEVKYKEYENLQIKINKLSQSENNQISRIAYKQHINNRIVNQQKENLNKLFKELELLEKENLIIKH